MKKHSAKKKIRTNVPESDPWEGREELRQKEDLIHLQKSVADELRESVKQQSTAVVRLFDGFLEIADFMFKNTCGVGSNFQLAECDLTQITRYDISTYYKYMLILLAHHFGQLVPYYQETVWQQVVTSTQDPELCRQFSKALETCVDHENGGFSPVQAGRKLWRHVQKLLHVKDTVKNSMVRIYYQTAPGQNLIYIVEQGAEAGWLKTE